MQFTRRDFLEVVAELSHANHVAWAQEMDETPPDMRTYEGFSEPDGDQQCQIQVNMAHELALLMAAERGVTR